jgi:heme exporter protein B
MSRWLRHALAIVARDLRREARCRDQVVATLVLALLILLVFAFAFDVAGEQVRRTAPGVLWVTLIFAGMSTAGRAFAGEQERGTLEGLILAPVDRGAIYFGKFLGIVLMMAAIEVVVLPAYAVFFNVPALASGVVGALAAGTLGFAAVAALFAAVAANTRAREVLLPVLLLPTATPLVIAGVRATDLALGGPAVGEGFPWLQLTLAAGVVYLAAALAVIDPVLEEIG